MQYTVILWRKLNEVSIPVLYVLVYNSVNTNSL